MRPSRNARLGMDILEVREALSGAAAVTGGLAPATDTGALDGVTAVNQPEFVGTGPQYTLVTVLVRRLDQAQFTPIGQGIAGGSGVWHVDTGGALPDGTYAVGAQVTSPAGGPGSIVPIAPGGRIVIDTTPPVAVSAVANRATGTLVVSFRDSLSGLDPKTLINPSNYALVLGNRHRATPLSATLLSTATVAPSDVVSVQLTFSPAARPWLTHPGAAVQLGSIADVAGNIVARARLPITAPPAGRA